MNDSMIVKSGVQATFFRGALGKDAEKSETNAVKSNDQTIQDIEIKIKINSTLNSTLDVDFENTEYIFSQMRNLEESTLFGEAQKSPENEKIAMLLS